MAAAVKAATKIQIGKEVTKGTTVAATRRLIGQGRFRRLESFEKWEDQDFGLLARTARAPLLTRNAAEFEYTAPLGFEEILLPLLSGLKGGVAAAGGGADKTWTFLPSATADPAPDGYTYEYVESDLTNNAEMEFGYGLVTELEITATVDGPPQLRFKVFGQKVVDSALTAGIAIPTEVFQPNLKWAIYCDPSWANLGMTQVLAQVYGFSWKLTNFIFPQYYLDGRATLDFSQYQYRKRTVDLSLDVVSDAAAAAFVQTEEANKSAGTARFVQAKMLGAALGGSNYKIQLDGAYYHAEDSMQERGNDRDGNLVTRVHLQSAYDPTSANDIQAIVVNALAAFP